MKMKLHVVATTALAALLSTATAQSASACTPTTVFIPVTSISTVTTCPTALAPAHSFGSTSTVTVTSTSTFTNYLTTTVSPDISAAAVATSPGGPTYYYSVVSGTTSWLNGISPSSGQALTTATTSIIVIPLSTVPDATIHLTSTSTLTQTITAPGYTSTIYSFAPVDLTTTSYSTIFTTISVFEATTVSTRRPSFPSIGGSGWNTTSMVSAVRSTGMDTHAPDQTATMTGIVYWGSGSQTTSTSTRFITTTLHETRTTTLWTDSSTVTVDPASSAEASSFMQTSATHTSFATLYPGTGGISLTSAQPASGSIPANSSTSIVVGPTGYATAGTSESAGYGSAVTVDGVNVPGHSTPSVFDPTLPTPTAISVVPSNNTTSADPIYGAPSAFPINGSINLSTLSVSESSNAPITIADTVTSSSEVATIGVTGLSARSFNSSSTGYSTPMIASTVSGSFPISTGGSVSVSNSEAPFETAVLSSLSTVKQNATSSVVVSGAPSISTSTPLVSPQPYSSNYSSLVTSISANSAIMSTMVSGPQSQLSLPANSSQAAGTGSRTTSSVSASLPFPPSSATAQPSSCGESGAFTLTFDNLPNFNPTNQNNTDITQSPPIPNPYNHLTFSDGYVYAPQPNESYTPRSAPHLAVFLADGRGRTTSTMPIGEIADGPYESSSAFWFDAHSAWLGCDNVGPQDCTIVMTGYTWDAEAADEILSYSQNTTIPACRSAANCALQQRAFPTSFAGLSGLQLQAYVGSESRMFFLDDLALSWTNNTCEAGLIRQTHR